MATDKNKQNLRYSKVCEHINKRVRYDGLSCDQIKLVKAIKAQRINDKELDYFWRNAPRKEDNSVNWDVIEEKEMAIFELIYKKHEKLLKTISKLEDSGVNIRKTMLLFNNLNNTSVSY